MIRVVIPENPYETRVWAGDVDLTEACPISKIEVTLVGGLDEHPKLRLEFEVFEVDATIMESEVMARFIKIFGKAKGEAVTVTTAKNEPDSEWVEGFRIGEGT